MIQELMYHIRRIDCLIQQKETGAPRELAHKLGIAYRTVFKYISLMKELGAPIKYDENEKTYVYKKPGSFQIAFIIRKKKAKSI